MRAGRIPAPCPARCRLADRVGLSVFEDAGEDGRVTPWFRSALIVAALGVAGCSEALHTGPLEYARSAGWDAAELKDKPNLQKKISEALRDLFGENPRMIRVPKGSGLPDGGRHLGNYIQTESGPKVVRFLDTKAPQE